MAGQTVGPAGATINTFYIGTAKLHSPSIAKLGKSEIGPQLPAASFFPAAVIHCDGSTDLSAKIRHFCADEEFDRHFLDVVVLVVPHHATKNGLRSSILKKLQADLPKLIAAFVIPDAIPEGPYFARDGKLHQTWRLYPDIYEAFHLPTIHELGTDKFIGVTVMHGGKLMVPVPSKLHFPKSDKPFNGLRLTVKEVIDLQGVKTSGQSRSYEKLYPPRKETALMVKRLVELGAVVIGKTKCTQFASSDQPTADWVDYHAPWNPRGDRYLSPRGSSTGTCVALAGYPWSEAGLGSDTGGSIRGPAAVMGLYAIRPTQSPEILPGILPIHRDIDTPGLVTRDPKLLHDLSIRIFRGINGNPHHDNKPKILLYAQDYWRFWKGNPAFPIMEKAVKDLESYLDTERREIDLAKKWEIDNPSGTGEPIADYLRDTFMTFLLRGYYKNFLDFRRDYEKEFGTPPYVHPVISDCWQRGEKITDGDVSKAQHRKVVYSRWLRESVLDSDFNVVMVHPVGDFDPFYRDVYRPDPKDRSQAYDWDQREDHQASLAGVPSIVVPVGQVSHPSKIIAQGQELPVTISLMSGAGTDVQLTGMIQDMAQTGFLVGSVKVGSHAF